MTTSATEAPGRGGSFFSPTVIIVAACLIAMIGFGVRSTFGLYLEPATVDRGWSRETYALALAIQNLLWGAGVPIAGALADRFGPTRVIAIGALIYAGGMLGMTAAETPWMLHLTAGLLTGIGIAFTAFSLALAAMARVVGPERRTFALGLGTAAGSFGQVIFSPFAQALITSGGWESTVTILGLISLAMLPLAFVLPGVARAPKASSASAGPVERPMAAAEQTIGEALREALGHQGFVLLTAGFFVCGFQVAFMTVHFPAYVKDLGLGVQVGALSLALIGLFNIIGSFGAGYLGDAWSKKNGLCLIYFLRTVATVGLLLAPKTELTIYVFAAVMGLLWLSTVPLTSGIVAQVFGVRYMATLFGVVFFSHQLGSFLGVWLGGYMYDRFGTYDPVWYVSIGLGLLAAIVHAPINERPLARLQPQAA